MLRSHVATLIRAAISRLVASGELKDLPELPVEVLDPRNPEHGDFACNYALIATKAAAMPPRQIAELLARELEASGEFASIEVAGPGFLNLRVRTEIVAGYIPGILALGEDVAKCHNPNPQRINVEFVSVNPNGPITVGSGRGAAYGDTLCRVLEAAGNQVDREFYINDGVNSEQMRLFAESVRHYYRQSSGLESIFPEGGYKGDYVAHVAASVRERYGDGHAESDVAWFQQVSQEMMVARQRVDLEEFGVVYRTWFSEQSLHESGKVERALQLLEQGGVADREPYSDETIRDGKSVEVVRKEQEPGPLWLRSTALGDEKDRVLVRADGRPAYIAADVAYMMDKFERGYDRLLLILGPDHHGYIGRMNAVCRALGREPEQDSKIVIFQIVRFVKDGQPAPMRKRDGNIYELRDLVQDVGVDVARFFYLMRSHDTHMDFDIDLATKQSDENPVYYVQYAHARICSVIARAAGAGIQVSASFDNSLLRDPRELALVKKILDLPEEVRRCAEDFGVHRLTTYAVELARTYHHFYDGCRVVQPEQPGLSQARVALCEAARIALKGALHLLGVSAPERMERDAPL